MAGVAAPSYANVHAEASEHDARTPLTATPSVPGDVTGTAVMPVCTRWKRAGDPVARTTTLTRSTSPPRPDASETRNGISPPACAAQGSNVTTNFTPLSAPPDLVTDSGGAGRPGRPERSCFRSAVRERQLPGQRRRRIALDRRDDRNARVHVGHGQHGHRIAGSIRERHDPARCKVGAIASAGAAALRPHILRLHTREKAHGLLDGRRRRGVGKGDGHARGAGTQLDRPREVGATERRERVKRRRRHRRRQRRCDGGGSRGWGRAEPSAGAGNNSGAARSTTAGSDSEKPGAADADTPIWKVRDVGVAITATETADEDTPSADATAATTADAVAETCHVAGAGDAEGELDASTRTAALRSLRRYAEVSDSADTVTSEPTTSGLACSILMTWSHAGGVGCVGCVWKRGERRATSFFCVGVQHLDDLE
eukprot:362901-Chlamydomonas_euryale.AAC.1